MQGRALQRFCTGNVCVRVSRSMQSGASAQQHYKLLIVGGGTGGCSMANKYARKLGGNNVAIIEPTDVHYYQPMFTLVGGGIKTLEDCARPMDKVLPKTSTWIKDRVAEFEPDRNTVRTDQGKQVTYDYLIIALGLQLDFDKVKGLPEAMESDPNVCSNYSSETVNKTFAALEEFKGGNALFTFPNTPIKCAGAPQKIMYLAEQHFRKLGVRSNTNVIFNTSLPVIFGVKKYADALMDIVKDRNINVNYRHNLIEVRPDTKEAVFSLLDSTTNETATFNYDFLHVTPPMSTPEVLRKSKLVDKTGFLDVDQFRLQHVAYPNVFGIGDCTNVPTAKTAAAVSGQGGVLSDTMDAVMKGQVPTGRKYDGYTSCPLVTSDHTCIMAEFAFEGKPMETFPVNQAKERRTMYYLKRDFMPELYWGSLLKGYWEGPTFIRKVLHLGMSK